MPISKRRTNPSKARKNETIPLTTKGFNTSSKYARIKKLSVKQLILGVTAIFGTAFTLLSTVPPDLKVGDDMIGFVNLETCPVEDRIVCDKNIVSTIKKVRHKIPVLQCKDHPGFLNNDVLCIQFDNTVNAVVVLDGKDKHHKTLKRRLSSSTEKLRAMEIFYNLGIVGDSTTYHIAQKSIVAGMGFYLENDVGVEYRANDYNKGNKLWEWAVLRMYNKYTTDLHHAYYMTEALKVDTSAMVISSGTALATDKAQQPIIDASKGAMAEYSNVVVERDVPTMVIGLGLVADYKEITQQALKRTEFSSFQTKFLLEAEEKGPGDGTPNIAVYGKITETICENSGVKACVAMGCPSLTINHEPTLGKVLQKKWNAVMKKIERGYALDVVLVMPELNGEGFVGLGSPAFLGIANLYTNICKKHRCTFIIQNEFTDKQYFLQLDFASEVVTEDQFKLFKGEVDEWLDYVKDKDFVVSARLRGGMAGIATSVPSIIIPTDYRIQEATEEMKVPKVTIKKVVERKYTSLIELMEDAEVNFKEFEINRREKISIYKQMINKAGLEMDPALESVLDKPLGF